MNDNGILRTGGTLLVAAGMALAASAAEWPVVKTYEGEFLRRVKMPLGGIGTGTVSLNGAGGLVDWEIRNRPDKGFTPCNGVSPCFAIRTETADGKVAARLLEGPVDTAEYEGQSGSWARNHGFARWRGCTFKAAYPLAQVELSDDAMPAKATLEAMNPLVQGDADASGIPAALLRWKISNATKEPMKASIICFMVNFEGGTDKLLRLAEGGLTGARLVSNGNSTNDVNRGEMVLALPDASGAVTVATDFDNTDWKCGFDRIWRGFVASGKAENYKDDEPRGKLSLATVCVSFELKAGETKRIPFALGWRFPHRYAWSKTDVGNYYATRYPTALAAVSDLLTNLPRYEAKTVEFVNGVLGRRAPAVVKEAALFNLSTLRCETCFRTADGHFFGWEGCFDHAGVCEGTCTHVWGYEHTLVDLWPALAKDVTELQFGPAMDDRGCIVFRIHLPLATNAREWKMDAADGHCQCLIKAYENWKKTGDDAWMKKLWPRIRKAMEFAWLPGGWDGDKDGVMEGSQHNTMDVEYFGPNPQMEFLYLAALKAVAAMADAAGEKAFAEECRGLVAKGSAWTEKNLFNGEYYEHRVVPMKVQPAEGTFSGSTKKEDPSYQLANGCLVDQLVGDYAARAVGLGPVADEKNAAKTIDTILRRNASANVAASFNHMRDFAMPEERALKMAWYPKDRMPKKPFPYYGENMTGFEYVLAANLAQRGDFARAEQVVKDIRDRYDGRKRSPFDEAECGHHYARALDAWSVMMAWPAGPTLKTVWGEKVTAENAWREYPRPQMVRDNWQNLNGHWDYAVTDVTKTPGRPAKWDGRILVPFALESQLSGVGRLLEPNEFLWYTRKISCKKRAGERILLHFGGVDLRTMVFIGHREVTDVPHEGGQNPFALDITDYVTDGENELTVCVWDPTEDFTATRGKQSFKPQGCFYTRVSGIWQTVWTENVPASYVASYKVVPDIDKHTATFTFETVGPGADDPVTVEVLRDGKSVAKAKGAASGKVVVKMPKDAALWSPANPALYDFRVTFRKDAFTGYFAMRKMSVAKDRKGVLRFFLNNRPCFLYGTLDQGWWPDGLLTPPSDEAMAHDIKTLKDCGFNMMRKHIKVEPLRYYYLCDRIGLMVLQDMPSGDLVNPFDPKTVRRYGHYRRELKEMMDNLFNAPSIVMWIPYNEGWTQPGEFLTHATLDWVKQYDPSRLVNGPSGWVDFEGGYVTHSTPQNQKDPSWSKHKPAGVCEAADSVDRHDYNFRPWMPDANDRRVSFLGEFGGIGCRVNGHLWTEKAWGYGDTGNDVDRKAVEKKYVDLALHVGTLAARGLGGCVYTQTTDVEAEINGLMTYDRKVLKFEASALKAAHEKVIAIGEKE